MRLEDFCEEDELKSKLSLTSEMLDLMLIDGLPHVKLNICGVRKVWYIFDEVVPWIRRKYIIE